MYFCSHNWEEQRNALLQSLISQSNLNTLVASSDLEMMEVAETACYLGASLSALIAQRIVVMPDKTFINKMFLWYFAVDAIMGTLITFLLFRVQRFRSNHLRLQTAFWLRQELKVSQCVSASPSIQDKFV